MDKEMAPKDNLFEAIISIKKGHNKPNAARICAYLQKKYNLTANRCIKAINHYTITGEIVAVNPGVPAAELSYRVADSSSNSGSLGDLPGLQGSLVNKFMAELIINEPNYLNEGVPPPKLLQYIEERQANLSKKEILNAIQMELSSGNLDTFDNGYYGYNPVDSSDEEPMSESDEKKKSGAATSSKQQSQCSPSVTGNKTKTGGTPSTNKGTTTSGAAAGGEKAATPSTASVVEANKRERKPTKRLPEEFPATLPTGKEERKENKATGRENLDKGDSVEKKPAAWKMKKRKCYADPKDEDFKPGSKDFKVDLSLERQARKRKEKKIFDPSALDSKASRKGRNGTLVKGLGTTSSGSGETAKISPGKKMSNTSSSGLGCGKPSSGSSSMIVPHGAAPITPLVPSSVCYLCQTYGKRIKGVPEKLISCVKCTTSKAHISCLNDVRSSNEKLMTTSAVNNWTCKKCSPPNGMRSISCVYCNQIKPGVVILECIQCKSGFHIPCHRSLIPTLMNKNITLVPATFKCVRCVPPQQQQQATTPSPARVSQRPQPKLLNTVQVQQKQQQQKPKSTTPSNQQQQQAKQDCPKVNVTQLKPKVMISVPTQLVNTTSVRPKSDPVPTPPTPVSLPPPSQKPPCILPWSSCTLQQQQQDPYANIAIDETVPDCSKWTAADVFEYLSAYLKPELCKPLLDGDVDGSALLLLKRSDCIRNLGLPLGFSLKLWTHVKRLQTRRSEIEIYWE